MPNRQKQQKTSKPSSANLAPAWIPVLEGLEDRTLFSSTTVQSLPFVLDFNAATGTDVLDKDGQGTGFTRVQVNKNGNQYQPALIDLDTAGGVLKLTSTGTSTAGTATNTDNTQVNALETQFDATTSGFKITGRLKGPLSQITAAAQQGGIYFGPDQDNFVKLVAVSQSGSQYLQFMDEQGATTHVLGYNTLQSVGSFSNITSLDLQLVGDAGSGTVDAYYALNGGSFVHIPASLTLTGTEKTAFFNATGRAGVMVAQKNNLAPITIPFDKFEIDAGGVAQARPSITASRPANGATNIPLDQFIACDVFLPNPGAGVDATTMTSNTVMLYRSSDHSPVAGVLNTSGGGDAIVLTPSDLLDPNTNYTFQVTSGLKDNNGNAFQPYTMSFTTGTSAPSDPSLAFDQTPQTKASGHVYTAVQMGKDGKLYAATADGLIQRFDIDTDGSLVNPFNITSIRTEEGANRVITGMAFDNAGNMWVSHSQFTDLNKPEALDFTGILSKLSGTNYSTAQRMVINLPRSVRDHMNNQPVFGPDGALYFCQAANNALGAPDNAWGGRPDHLLNDAILRVDTSKLTSTPLNVLTPDAGGTYNPFAAGAPLTIYATGVRNAYDLVWTSKGRLFAPTNGSAAGGSTPATPPSPYSFGPNQRIDYPTNGAYTGPNVPALTNVSQTEDDYLYNVVQGGYYGHPNPTRGEFVLDGGNPTSGTDANQFGAYPVGTLPDRNYRGNITGTAAATRGSAYTIGKNYSADGIIEYHGDAFGGKLEGKLLVAEYSGGDDIAIFTPDVNGNITNVQRGIAGLGHFIDPVDLTEDTNTGFLYVAEYGGQKITLVRPITPGAHVSTDKPQMVFTDSLVTTDPAQKLVITNTGTTALTLNSDALQILGTDASKFAFVNKPALPLSIQPGDSITLNIQFTASTVGDIRTATLQIKSSDPDTPIFNVPLRGLGLNNLTGSTNEPSLQQIFNLYQFKLNDGDTTPAEVNLNDPPAQPNDEVVMPVLTKAGSGPVTIEPLATFGVGGTIATFRFGTYSPGSKNDQSELLRVVGANNSQTVNPVIQGVTNFDPGAGPFGLYTYWENFTGSTPQRPTVYSEDYLNVAYDSHSPRKVRFYPLKDAAGTVEPNAFIFAFEEFNKSYDNQDFVGIIRNVKAAPAGPEIGFENLDGQPFTDRLVFNRIQVQPPASYQSNGSLYTPPPNFVHDVAKLRIRNTGNSPLTITAATLSDTTNFKIDNPPTLPLTIGVGGSVDLAVRFIATSGGQRNATLTINSNDADEPTKVIQLAGWWQNVSEGSPSAEPPLGTIYSTFGYTTKALYSGQSINTGGKVQRVGDEVLSPYWKAADPSSLITVRQLSAFHQQGKTAAFYWFPQGGSTQTLFTHDGDEGQSFLPHTNNGTVGVLGLSNAGGSFSSSGTFGFKLDLESSVDSSNPQEKTGGGYGHHVRFFPARDRNGIIIPNTYLATMDYYNAGSANYDYNDNVYLISNVKPVSGPAAPTGLTASSSGAGIALNWNDNTDSNLGGYNVYRSTSSSGPFTTKLNAQPLITSDFLDVTGSVNQTYYYVIKAVDNAGTESAATTPLSAMRGSDTTAPAIPKNLFATGGSTAISLDWSDNTEVDLAGYNLYRSSSSAGPFTFKVNTSLIGKGTSSFVDASAPAGQVSYYQVTAVDTSGNESGHSGTASATKQTADTTPPAPPGGLTAGGDSSGITLDWLDNAEGDLAGYFVYRASSAGGPFTKISGNTPLGLSVFDDATAPAGQTSYYRVTAVDKSNNESTGATANAFRPTDTTAPANPAGLVASGGAGGIALTWTANQEADLAGYNVYRANSAAGPFTSKVNTSGLVVGTMFTDSTAPAGQTSYYVITAVDASTNESGQSNVASAARPAAPAYTQLDIGNPTPAGSLTTITEGKDYDLVGGGADIWNTSDSFSYAYKQLTGDFDIKVRIASIGSASSLIAKGGLMARSSLAANSANAFALAMPSGHRFSYRSTTGGTTTSGGNAATNFPNDWVRLSRSGNVFTGYVSTNGTDWTQLGTATISMPSTVYFGLAALSHNTSVSTTVQFRDLQNTAAPVDEPPISPANLVATGTQSGIQLDWDDDTTDADLAGYNVYRSNAPGGAFSLVNSGGLLTDSTYLDVDAPAGQTSYYQVVAVDAANQQSLTPATASADRPAPDLTPPAAPAGATASGDATGVTVSWSANTETDLAGYNVYRSDSPSGPFTTKVNTSGLITGVTSFKDTTAPTGAVSYYQVTAVDTSGNESGPSAVANAARPDLFTQVDVGSPTPPGSMTTVTEGKDYDLVGGGADIWGTADSFSYAYEQVTGDFDIKVRIAGMDATSSNVVKGGLMARASLDANSANAFALAMPTLGHRFSARTTTGGTTTSVGNAPNTYPNDWVRLVRVGNTFTGYVSSNGTTWTQLGSATIAMPTTVYLGMAALSHNTAASTTVQFRDLQQA